MIFKKKKKNPGPKDLVIQSFFCNVDPSPKKTLISGTLLWKLLFVISGFSLYQGECAKKYKKQGPAKYNEVALYNKSS